MPRLPYEQLGNPASPILDPIVSAAGNAARGAFCGAYAANPGGFNPPVGPNFNAVALPMNALARAICPLPLPIPNIPPPFEGGQCVGVNYRVQGSYVSSTGPLNGSFSPVLPGPISGYVRAVSVNGIAGQAIGYGNGLSSFIVEDPGSAGLIFSGLSVSRVDGGNDNCGTIPQGFAPNPTALPPTYERPPVVIVPPGGGPGFRFPVRFLPTIPRLPGLTFAPEINVQVGPFVFNFGPFDFEWNIAPVTFAPSFPIFAPGSGGVVPPAVPPQLPPPLIPCPPCPVPDLTPVLDAISISRLENRGRLAGLLQCLRLDRNFSISDLGQGTSGSVALPERTIAVSYRAVSGLPANRTKVQLDPSGGSTVYLSNGWCRFVYGAANGRRSPLEWERGILLVENYPRRPSPSSFVWTSTIGTEYIVSAYVLNNPPLDYPERPCQS